MKRANLLQLFAECSSVSTERIQMTDITVSFSSQVIRLSGDTTRVSLRVSLRITMGITAVTRPLTASFYLNRNPQDDDQRKLLLPLASQRSLGVFNTKKANEPRALMSLRSSGSRLCPDPVVQDHHVIIGQMIQNVQVKIRHICINNAQLYPRGGRATWEELPASRLFKRMGWRAVATMVWLQYKDFYLADEVEEGRGGKIGWRCWVIQVNDGGKLGNKE